jgi:glycosyltransferase involved in cell wall biosynthesis
VQHTALKRHYQEAQIVLFTSRYEGFPIAGEEALSCGCSVVGPATLPAFPYMASESSGTCAISRETGDMCDALLAEMTMWRRGLRDPKRISDAWRGRAVASSVAAQVISL